MSVLMHMVFIWFHSKKQNEKEVDKRKKKLSEKLENDKIKPK